MELIDAFLGRNGLLPHGYCISNSPGLLWSMVVTDSLVALAYFSIPLAIVHFMRQRPDIKFRGLAWLFSAFIFACGVTHVMDVWTLWFPDYAVQTLTKAMTAGLSVLTAAAVWRSLPQAVQIPTAARLRSVEEQLAEVQQNLALTLASIGAGFIGTDRNGCVTRMNVVAERICGWTQNEAMGQSVWHVLDREDRPESYLQRNPVDVMIEEGYSVEVGHERMAISRNGMRTPIEVKAALTHAADGSVSGIAVVFRDLTRAVLAEAESGRLAAIVESSNDAIIGKTLDGRITSWNRAAQQMFGYSAEEILGQPVQLLIPPERQVEEMRILAELSRGATVPPFDTVRRARDGRLLQVSLTVSPIRNQRGSIIGASKIVRDVTEQRRSEAALRESENQLRFTLESAQIGEWQMDLDTNVVERSVRHDRCFGYDMLQPLWTRDTTLQHVHPEDRAELEAAADKAIQRLVEFSAEYRVIWPDGSTHWLQAHGNVRHEGGVPTRMVGIVMDITTKKLAEQARLTAQRLEAENRQIQAASALKSQFLANMSHELRTPLNAIIGFADLLRGGVVSAQSPKHGEYLGHIGSSGRHLLQLINDVLDLSKVESGKFDFYPEPLQLTRVVAEVRDVLAVGAQRKNISIDVDIAEAVDELTLDRARLKQVLYNYLSNAIKFSAAGGRVKVRALPEGAGRWRLEVQDTGIGIAREDLPRLFRDFQQLDTGYNKQHEGTGLGLALTRRLVEAQGGRVGVASELGVGSTFFLVLDRTHRHGQTPTANSKPSPGRRLLVLEGDESHQSLLVSALSQAGFSVDAAADGLQALSLSAARAYHAVTVDLELPSEGGLAALGRVREASDFPDAPVLGVSMTGGDASHRVDGATATGRATFSVRDVLFKPLRTDQVGSVLAPYRERRPEPARVLVVDDDHLALSLMQATLAGLGVEAICMSDARQALRDMDQIRPDAMVLDLMMPGFDGFAVLHALQEMPSWRDLPVYIWTSLLLSETDLELLRRSARAVLLKGGGGIEPLLDNLRHLPDTAFAAGNP
jgi:PAS domain S-box-containing protein